MALIICDCQRPLHSEVREQGILVILQIPELVEESLPAVLDEDSEGLRSPARASRPGSQVQGLLQIKSPSSVHIDVITVPEPVSEELPRDGPACLRG